MSNQKFTDDDKALIEKLAAINCTVTEIASAIGCSVSLLSKEPYSYHVAKGREDGKSSLRRTMWKSAVEDRNTTMMIWLSKQMLGYTDKLEQKVETNHKEEIIVDLNWADETIVKAETPNPSPEADQRVH